MKIRLFSLTLLLFSAACGKAVTEVQVTPPSVVQSLADLPECTTELEGHLVLVEQVGDYFRCDSGTYVPFRSNDPVVLPSDPNIIVEATECLEGEELQLEQERGGVTVLRCVSVSSEPGMEPPDPVFTLGDGWIRWLGSVEDRPEAPEPGDAVYWQGEGALCAWDGVSWILLHVVTPGADCKEWEEPEVFELPTFVRDAHPKIAMDGRRGTFLMWSSQSAETFGGDFIFVQKHQVGEGWSELTQIGGERADFPRLVVDEWAAPTIYWSDRMDWPYVVKRSYFEGTTWTTELLEPEMQEVLAQDSFPVEHPIVRSTDGTTFVAWNYDGELFVSRRSPNGQLLGVDAVPKGMTQRALGGPMATGLDGEMGILWRDTETDAWDVYFSHYQPSAGWSLSEKIFEAKGISRGLQLHLGSDGRRTVLLNDDPGGFQYPHYWIEGTRDGGWTAQQFISMESDASWSRLVATGSGALFQVADRDGLLAREKTADAWSDKFDLGSVRNVREWGVAPVGADDLLVVWTESFGHRVHMQRFSASLGGWQSPEEFGETDGFQHMDMASDQRGNAAIVWEGEDEVGVRFLR